jgi:hypothetical protein
LICRGIARRSRVVDVVLQAGWRTYGHNPRSEFDAYGDIVVGDKAAFAKADCQLLASAKC